jgi:hypothetical protein
MADEIVLVSSTDSEEDVQTAMGITKDDRVVGEAPVADETPVGAALPDEAETDQEDQQGGVYMVPAAIPSPQIDDTNEDGSPKYENYEQFLLAHSEWTMEEATRRLEERQVTRRAHEAIHATHVKAVAAFKRTHSDFDAALKGVKPAVTELVEELGPNALGVIDRYTTSDADNGPAIIYHLAQNPEELKRIARLPPAHQLIALGKLDVVVAGDRSGSRRKSSAVAAARSSTHSDPDVMDSDDYAVWKAQRNKEERARRG